MLKPILFAALAFSGTLLCLPSVAHGEDSCSASIASARTLERAGQMLAAERELAACRTHTTCDEARRSACEARLVEVERAVPSIVIAIRDVAGRDVAAARVLIDGVPVAGGNGGEVRVDPGPHRIMVEYPGGTASTDIVARAGERRRVIEIGATPSAAPASPAPGSIAAPTGGMAPTPAPAAPPPAADDSATDNSTATTLAIIGFTVGGVGVLAGVITGALAVSRFDELETQCQSVGCTQDEIDSGTTLAHVSTASFVVGGVGAVVGLVSVLWSTTSEEADVTPLVGPGYLGLRARF